MCQHPLIVKRLVAGTYHYEQVPCGRCPECRKKMQSEFATRVMEEARNGIPMYFITLTYRDEALKYETVQEENFNPYTGEITYDEQSIKSVYNKDISDWKKRVKRHYEYLGKKQPVFNYAICGEYGPKTARPHYHGIIFCDDPEFVNALNEDWKAHNGYTCFKRINTVPHHGKSEVVATARYVAKYVVKLKELEYEPVRKKLIKAPRKLTSRGFGMVKDLEAVRRHYLAQDKYNYDPNTLKDKDTGRMLTKGKIKDIIKTIRRRKHYDYNGQTYPLSQYLRRKIYYTTSSLTGKAEPLQIQRLVSASVRNDISKDYHDQLRELASQYGYEMDYQACKDLDTILETIASSREETILQTNIKAFQTSLF